MIFVRYLPKRTVDTTAVNSAYNYMSATVYDGLTAV